MIRKKPFDAVQLRLFALLFMLLDHVGRTLLPSCLWLQALGRLSFPIFAFQTAEGFRHTSNVRRYALRLLLFALLSELPFNLLISGQPFYPQHQNVLFTLLLGLLGLHFSKRFGALAPCLAALLGALANVDYGAVGVFTVVTFGVLDDCRLSQLAAMILLHVVLQRGPTLWGWFPIQGLAVLTLGFIWLYNGEKGPRNRFVQLGSYWFYPVHLLVLTLLRDLTL